MSNDNPGRTPRSTSGNAPMGSTIAIVVTAVAVVLGFLILRKINDDSGDAGTSVSSSTLESSTSLDPSASTTIAFTTPPTSPPLVTAGTKVQVANASNASGTARQMSTALAGKNFDMAEATNATLSPKLDTTKVIYDQNDPNALNVANSVALVLGGVAVEPAPTPPPVVAGAFAEGSGVIVLLGNDLAGKTLPSIAGEPTTGTTAAPSSVAPSSSTGG